MEKSIENKVGIVGLGWLGEALYHQLDSSGITAFGTRTSRGAVHNMRENGVNAFCLNMNPKAADDSWKSWFVADALVINIPPGRKDPDATKIYPEKISQLLTMASQQQIKRVLFVSSTSVFGGAQGVVNDDTPLQPNTASGEVLVECEKRVIEAYGENAAVVRYGGLYGPGRHPGRFFAGRKNVKNGDAPVNFIHQSDAVGVILHLLKQSTWGIQINACAPAHPPRNEFYSAAAKDFKSEPPTFVSGGANHKKISCRYLRETQYVFRFPELGFRNT